MKNVFARTVLALILIPSFWTTSVGTATAGGWTHTPGATVGRLLNGTHGGLSGKEREIGADGVFGGVAGCGILSVRHRLSQSHAETLFARTRYIEFIPNGGQFKPGGKVTGGKCRYYEERSSKHKNKSGPHTWRYDE